MTFSPRFLLPAVLALSCALATAAAAEKKSGAPFLLYSATVNGTPIAVHMAERPFDPARHKTTPPREAKGNKPFRDATVDGKPVLGFDGAGPGKGTPQLSQLFVKFGNKRVDVPRRLLSHVFLPFIEPANKLPDAHNLVTVADDCRSILIRLTVGDGAGIAGYAIYVNASGTCKAGRFYPPPAMETFFSSSSGN